MVLCGVDTGMDAHSGWQAGAGDAAPGGVKLPSKKFIALLLVWLAFIAWNGWGFFIAFTAGGVVSFRPMPPVLAAASNTGMILNFWGLAAALFPILNAMNPFGWGNGKRLAFGCMAGAIMAGRLFIGPVFSLAAWALPPLWLFLAAPLAMMVSGMITSAAVTFAVGTVFLIFTIVPTMLFYQLSSIDRAFRVYRHESAGLVGYIGKGIRWLVNEPEPDMPPDDGKGARFATEAEIAAMIARPDDPAFPRGMAFGHRAGPLTLLNEKHVLIMASTRSGKGVTLIIPHLLRYRGSAFVLDPKGENARATSRRRAQLNDRLHVLDPFGITGLPQSRFNPLSRFTPVNMEAESKALAAAMFVMRDSERDHWNAAGQQLLAAIVMFVYLSPGIPRDKKDLPQVRKILLGSLKPALNAMTAMDEADGLLRDLAVSFLETPEREFGSIVSTAQRQTEILDNPFMVACLSASGKGEEVDFAAWKSGTMTVYLCLSAPKFPTFNRWLRLVLTSALDEMTDTLNPPPLPVCFMLDELATLGHLATVENAVGLAAGYGIQLVTVFQDVAQMRDLYKGRWASFIGNSGVRALFNLDDFETAEYWSKFVGGSIVETRGRQVDPYGDAKSENVGETMRPLLPADKLMMELSSDRMLVLAQGAHPVISARVPYWNDPELSGLWDDPRPSAKPAPARTTARTAPAAPPVQTAPSPTPAPAPARAAPKPTAAPVKAPIAARASTAQTAAAPPARVAPKPGAPRPEAAPVATPVTPHAPWPGWPHTLPPNWQEPAASSWDEPVAASQPAAQSHEPYSPGLFAHMGVSYQASPYDSAAQTPATPVQTARANLAAVIRTRGNAAPSGQRGKT